MHQTDTSALVAGVFAIALSAISLLAQWFLRFKDHEANRKREILQQRQQALLAALSVIDHVYANSSFGPMLPSNPHQWDIMLARDAMNQMAVFCQDPNRTIAAFTKAIGLHDPATTATPQFGPEDLAAFRNRVCEELETSKTGYADKDRVWIYKLPGA